MSLTSSLFSGVSGLTGQSRSISIIGDNIANLSTVGFKSGEATFSSLVTADAATVGGAGTTSSNRQNIDQQGLIQGTGVATDVAISGQGFFVVKDNPEFGDGSYTYTRAGSFRQDDLGYFVNTAGYYLQAWPLDNEGLRPGEIGNENTTSSQLLESLQSVNTRDISGLAFATTRVELGLNLDASENILQGAGDTFTPSGADTSGANYGIDADDVLIQTGTVGGGATGIVIGDQLSVTLGTGNTYTFTYGGIAYSDAVTVGTPLFGATSAGDRFTVPTDGDNFTVGTGSVGTFTFTYKDQGTVSTDLGEFNSLSTLAEAIDNVDGLSARVANNRLWIAPDDANEAMTITDVTGTIAADMDATAAPATFVTTTAGTNRFASLQGLANVAIETGELGATVNSPANASTAEIYALDPLTTILFDEDATSNDGTFKLEFDLTRGTVTPGTPPDYADVTIDPIYAATGGGPTSPSSNMASGEISPNFSRNIRIFDSLGNGHDVRVNFAKIGNNLWASEVVAVNPDELISNREDGLIAYGNIEFNGDGTLRNVDAGLTNPVSIVWANEALSSSISFDFGTAGLPGVGLSDGLSQLSGNYNVQFADQNGAGSGLLSSLEINEIGEVIANFSNGESRKVFQIPLAAFPNANGLTAQEGNVFDQSDNSGEFSLQVAGGAGVGKISVRALERATTELSEELTLLIEAQRAFQANTKIITTADELLEELNRI